MGKKARSEARCTRETTELSECLKRGPRESDRQGHGGTKLIIRSSKAS